MLCSDGSGTCVSISLREVQTFARGKRGTVSHLTSWYASSQTFISFTFAIQCADCLCVTAQCCTIEHSCRHCQEAGGPECMTTVCSPGTPGSGKSEQALRHALSSVQLQAASAQQAEAVDEKPELKNIVPYLEGILIQQPDGYVPATEMQQMSLSLRACSCDLIWHQSN